MVAISFGSEVGATGLRKFTYILRLFVGDFFTFFFFHFFGHAFANKPDVILQSSSGLHSTHQVPWSHLKFSNHDLFALSREGQEVQ